MIPLIAFYPKWAQAIFLISFASVLLSLFVFVALYSTASDNRTKVCKEEQVEATLSEQAKQYLQVFKTSHDSKELRTSVDYFKANPTEAALEALASLAARDEERIEGQTFKI